MLLVTWLVLTLIAAVSAGVCHLVRLPIYPRDLIAAYATMLVAAELAMLGIRLFKGNDQAAAAQAGMTGMMLLMIVAVGILVTLRVAGIVTQVDSLVRWSLVLFVPSLVLVALDAIRTIKSSPMAGGNAANGSSRADESRP